MCRWALVHSVYYVFSQSPFPASVYPRLYRDRCAPLFHTDLDQHHDSITFQQPIPGNVTFKYISVLIINGLSSMTHSTLHRTWHFFQ